MMMVLVSCVMVVGRTWWGNERRAVGGAAA